MSDFTSGFWNLYVIVLTVASIAGCAWLLIGTGRIKLAPKTGAEKGPVDKTTGVGVTGHVWDGDLQEHNNPLPKWWSNLLWITIDALEAIKKDAVDIQYENRSGQDVTNIYIDLQSQLRAKEAAEKKLLEILDQADETEDVLAVYTQLQMIQSEIEVLKGQIKYYDESVALSAVSVRLIAEETVKPVEIGGWKLQGAANNAIQDLINFTQGFTRFLMRFVLYTLPALILIAIPLVLAFLGGRALVRRFGRSKVKVEVQEEEKK